MKSLTSCFMLFFPVYSILYTAKCVWVFRAQDMGTPVYARVIQSKYGQLAPKTTRTWHFFKTKIKMPSSAYSLSIILKTILPMIKPISAVERKMKELFFDVRQSRKKNVFVFKYWVYREMIAQNGGCQKWHSFFTRYMHHIWGQKMVFFVYF